MSKRRLQLGLESLMVLGVGAALLWAGGALSGSLLAAGPSAQVQPIGGDSEEDTTDLIPSGYDSWTTPDNGSTRLTLDFPPGFFCGGLSSELRNQPIAFKGVPFPTDPAGEAGEADTLIERLDPAVFVEGVATTRIRIVGLSLVSSRPFVVTCPNGTHESWTVKVGLDASVPAPIGSMTIRQNAANTGGTFDSDFEVPARITLQGSNGAIAGPLTHLAHLTSRNAPWARIVQTRFWHCRVGYWIDLDGDGLWDIYIEVWRCPGGGGFHPGWQPHPTPGQPGIPVPWDHSAPHPEIWPVCVPSCRPVGCVGTGTGSGSGTGSGTAQPCRQDTPTGVVGN